MKTRVSKLYFGEGIVRYLVEHRNRWWQKWHYVMDGQYPRLFSAEEIKSLGYEPVLQKM